MGKASGRKRRNEGEKTTFSAPSKLVPTGSKQGALGSRCGAKRNATGSGGINDKFVLTHGAINSTDAYTLSAIDAAKNFRLMQRQLLPSIGFFGHTHAPIAYAGTPDLAEAITEKRFDLKEGLFYFINPGSVGQPRDGDARASFLIFDSSRNEVSFYRVEYDIKACADKIKATGLPEILAERLFRGY